MTTVAAEGTTGGRDAAYPGNIGNGWGGVVGGYLDSPYAFNPWTPSDWVQFHNNRKLPIYVPGYSGKIAGADIVRQLQELGVPKGNCVEIDMETRIDKDLLDEIFQIVRVENGWKVLVYGSESTVFSNPRCNGYNVASYDDNPNINPSWPRTVRGKQYATNNYFDSNTWKQWVTKAFWL